MTVVRPGALAATPEIQRWNFKRGKKTSGWSIILGPTKKDLGEQINEHVNRRGVVPFFCWCCSFPARGFAIAGHRNKAESRGNPPKSSLIHVLVLILFRRRFHDSNIWRAVWSLLHLNINLTPERFFLVLVKHVWDLSIVLGWGWSRGPCELPLVLWFGRQSSSP